MPQQKTAGVAHSTRLALESCGALAAVALALLVPAVPASAALDVTAFDGVVLREDGSPATQAGSHPHTGSTTFFVTTTTDPEGRYWSTEDIQNVIVDLPKGLVVNPQTYPTCTQDQLLGLGGVATCPPESQVGTVTLYVDGEFSSPPDFHYVELSEIPVFNMETSRGTLALFGLNVVGGIVQIYGELGAGDYHIAINALNAPQTLPFEGATFTFWGVPADPAHTPERSCESLSTGCPSTAPLRPFITLPTACGAPLRTSITVDGWQAGSGSGSFLSHDNSLPEPTLIGADGCNSVDFLPSLQARPTTNVADAPSGLDVDLHLPQNEDPYGTATAHLRDLEITLPDGLVINPAGANGIDGCSPGEFDLDGPGSPDCPHASRLGMVEAETPLLDHPLPGSVFLADPYESPFDSLFALYVVVDDPISGGIVKLAGQVSPDPVTGRLSAVFEENPQLPFEDLRLKFFGGAGGPLRTPAVCGRYSTTSLLTPWTAPDGAAASPSDVYAIEHEPAGGTCPKAPAALPNAPSLDAGTVSPLAGASSPFVLKLERAADTQSFDSLSLTAPPGLTATLNGIPYCRESVLAAISSVPGTGRREVDNASCPGPSRVGTITIGAGAGPQPLFISGKVYLAGPYKGAPLSLAVVVPAVAGPFDLGTVLLRIAVQVDPLNAQLHLSSDRLPSILAGIPLDLRTIHIVFDRPDFTRNPTSCKEMSVVGTATSLQGTTSALSNRFQVGDCLNTGFRPRINLRVSDGTGRNGRPTLIAVLKPRAGDANLSAATVTVPRGMLIDTAQLTGICTRERFAAADCPASSTHGWARVWSPLLEQPLQGRIYLRESDRKYPDLAVDLDGQFRLALVGRLRTPRGTIRVGFSDLPDVPISRLKLALEGGRGGLLVNSEGICRRERRATLSLISHDGVRRDLRPRLTGICSERTPKATYQRRAGAR